MSAIAALYCDDEDCAVIHAEPCEQRWVLRMRAEDAGWRCDDAADLCPLHVPTRHLETTDA